jgi:hypothetical protein
MNTLFFTILCLLKSISSHQPPHTVAGNSNRMEDSLTLVQFFIATDGPNWTTTWDLNDPMTAWPGVILETTGRVAELHLNGNQLNGIIPFGFGTLTELKELSLINNKLTGSLPNSIGNLIKLEDIALEENDFYGTIPSQISNLVNLKYINLAKNSFSGPLPAFIGNLKKLIILNVSENQIESSIPASIGLLDNLNILDLSRNYLSGQVPSEIGQMSSIKEIYLGYNLLSGVLPASIANLTSLVHFWVNDNLLTGLVPDLRFALALYSCHLENNSFNQIPDFSIINSWGNQATFGLVITGNKFTFEDLIPLKKIPSRFYYAFDPQDPVTLDSIIYAEIGTNHIIMTGVDPAFTENNYKWFKDTDLVYISNRNVYELLNVKEADEGYYSGIITNPMIPNFEIGIAQFRVVSYDPRFCNVPQASAICSDAPEFCNTSKFHGYCGTLSTIDTNARLILCDSVSLFSNAKWVSFIAPSDSIVFEIFPRNCVEIQEAGKVYKGVQVSIWNSCTSEPDSIVVCHSICTDQPITIGGKYFEIGRKYYFEINGCHGSICDFIIKVIAGKSIFNLINPGSITGPKSFCPDNLDHFFSIQKIPGTSLYQWFINDTLFSNTVNPVVNIKNLGPGYYKLSVRGTNSCDTTQASITNFRVTPKLLLKNPKHTKVRIDSAYQISFSIEGGIKPYQIIKGRGYIDTVNSIFYSDTLLCLSAFDFEIIDSQFCSIQYIGFENCNCNSKAGSMPTDTITVCEGQSFTVKFIGSEQQDPTDAGVYILFSNPLNPKSSILKTSSNGLFPFNPSVFRFDSVFYVARVVGRADIRGDVRFDHPCVSYSNFQSVIFRARPIVSTGQDLTFCGLEGNLSSFGNFVTGIWKQVSGPSNAFIESPPSDETKVIVNNYGSYIFSREVTNLYCTHKDEVKITFIETLRPGIDGFLFVCPGQTTTLDGGEYSNYLWSTGATTRFITVNTSGTYCLTITESGNCTGSTCVAVSNSSAPVPFVTGPDSLCTGKAGIVQVSQGFINYKWNTNDSTSFIQIDTGGRYCVTVTSTNGCTGVDCIDVNPKSRSFQNRFDTICYGGRISILGQIFDTPGIHDVIIKNAARNGCDSVVRIHLFRHPEIVLLFTNVMNDQGNGNGSIQILAGGGKFPYGYRWNNGATTSTISNLTAGDYTVTVTDANSCQAIFNFTIKKVTSVFDEKSGKSRFIYYPNPVNSSNSLTIENKTSENQLNIFISDLNGKKVYSKFWNSSGYNDKIILNHENLRGVYYLCISESGGSNHYFKILFIN